MKANISRVAFNLSTNNGREGKGGEVFITMNWLADLHLNPRKDYTFVIVARNIQNEAKLPVRL